MAFACVGRALLLGSSDIYCFVRSRDLPTRPKGRCNYTIAFRGVRVVTGRCIGTLRGVDLLRGRVRLSGRYVSRRSGLFRSVRRDLAKVLSSVRSASIRYARLVGRRPGFNDFVGEVLLSCRGFVSVFRLPPFLGWCINMRWVGEIGSTIF